MDCRRVGHVREQPKGEVLFHHEARSEAARGRNGKLGANCRCDWPRAESGKGAIVMSPRQVSRLRTFAAKHLRLLTERFVSQGMSREEAVTSARRQFGNTTLLREDRREIQTL